MCLAVPVQVDEIFEDGKARVELDGVKLDVATALVEDLKVGDYVLLHAGFIIQKITKEDADDKLALWAEYHERLKGQENE